MDQEQTDVVKERLRSWMSKFVFDRAEVGREYVFSHDRIAREADVTESQVDLIESCVKEDTRKGFGLIIKVRPEFTVSISVGRHPIGGKALVALFSGHGQILTYESDRLIKAWVSEVFGNVDPLRTDLFVLENVPTETGIFIARIRTAEKDLVLYDWTPVTPGDWDAYLQRGAYPWTEYGEILPPKA